MNHDAFSKCHPLVNFLFFVGAIGAGVMIQHPAYLLVGVITGTVYYLLLNGNKGVKTVLLMLPLFAFLAVINPLFNLHGETLLFHLFGRPYTLEALFHGAAVGAIFVVMLLWFGCYNKVLTSDKFTSLFGSVIPSISLLLVMVLRMVPNLMRKAGQFAGARKSLGKGVGTSVKEKLGEGVSLLDALTSWALEGGITTGDSMRARGYGATKRSSFMLYRMTILDWLLLGSMLLLLITVIIAACGGQMEAEFTPAYDVATVSWGLVPYTLYLLLPIVLHIKETIQWHISRSKI